MCGIYGAVALRPGGLPSADDVRRMAAATVHRGPDDEGLYADPHVVLGMRRLAIIDVASGQQPLANEDGTLQVVCNGEIYNYRELTQRLVDAGHRFRSKSDCEVLVHLYEEYGDDFVSRLNGMFAFALWDGRRRRLLIGRDRIGIKPLYFRTEGGRLWFASEAKAILAASGPAGLDATALQEFLALGYTPAPLSMFEGVSKLPPASLLICQEGRVVTRRFWSPVMSIDDRRPERDWESDFVETMQGAVTSQMVSEVPLGAFLSGGIDSSAIVAFMARASSRPVKTYSIGFEAGGAGGYYNELPWARRVAARFATDHHEIVVRPNVARLLPRLLWHMDEPVADTAFVTTFLVAEFARREVTVILSGVGGDELFGGYRRYLGPYVDGWVRLVPALIRSTVLPPIASWLPSDRHSALMNASRQVRSYLATQHQPFPQRYRSYVQVFSRVGVASLLREPLREDGDVLDAAFRELDGFDPVSQMSRVDLLTQLPDDLLLLTDKMTMAPSLECRVPWLDNTVVDLSLRMPARCKIRGRRLKHVLKRALRPFLPPEILERPKRGFGAPMGAWLRDELAPLTRQLLSREVVEKRGLLRWEAVRDTAALHESSRADHTDHLLALIALELWARLYLDGRTVDDVTAELSTGGGE